MKNNLLEFKKNIISWYPIEKKDTVLQIGKDDEILEELKLKSNNVSLLESFNNEFEMKAKFNYVILIGNFEKAKSKKDIIELIEFASKCLDRDGKILLAMKNKFGMKYWAGEKAKSDSEIFETIVSNSENILSYNEIKDILDNLKLKYKFYYPLPDYKITNVIYTDEFMPSNDSIDARDLTYCIDEETLVFSEREAYKQLIKEDKKEFPFFANSYFIEISNKSNFSNIKYVSYGITRKKEYRIKTIIEKDKVYKTENSSEAKEHIKGISKNIDILNRCKIECLDSIKNNMVVSKFLENSKSYDEFLMDIYYAEGLEKVIEKIQEFKENIINKLAVSSNNTENTVFEKYKIEISDELIQKLHFTENGVIDLIFQNCLVKDNKIFAYDQEWYEENVPIEFILYRAIFYFTELKKCEDINKVYKALNLTEYKECFEKLENIIQENILDKEMWELHINSTKSLGGSKNIVESYELKLNAANEHIKNLEANVEQYKKGIEDLNNLIKEKDAGLEDYANQLRAISNSLSWKITKPIRKISGMLARKK